MKSIQVLGIFMFMPLTCLPLAAAGDLPDGATSPIRVIECKDLKYSDLPIEHAALLKKMVDTGDQAFTIAGRLTVDPKDYPEVINTVCSQISCLSLRDKIGSINVKAAVVKGSTLPPLGKQQVADDFDKLGLSKCVSRSAK